MNRQMLASRHVTVMGLGRHGGGAGAIRFLAREGARITLTDVADEHALRESLDLVADVHFEAVHLGAHRAEDFQDAEFVVVNPAVRPNDRFVRMARDAGATITSEIELFLDRCPARVIGVTGTHGKSTTAAMIAGILEAGGDRVWLGGNIERSLLPDLDQIASSDWVVLELSSFQLAWLSPTARRPEMSVVTNHAPNHLDWHGDEGAYIAAKRNLTSDLGDRASILLGDASASTIYPEGQMVAPLEGVSLTVPGEHNRRNAAIAIATAIAAGCPEAIARRAVADFVGLDHRLQTIGTRDGRTVINDSQSTTPQATIEALATVHGRCWLLAGGADKGSTFDALAAEIVRNAAGVALFGQTGPALAASLMKIDARFPHCLAGELSQGLDWCWKQSRSGDTILLSPACSSRDQYRDYADRAEDFVSRMKIGNTFRRSQSAVP